MVRAVKLVFALLATGGVIAGCGGGQRSADPIEQVPETGGLREKLRAASQPRASDFPAATGRNRRAWLRRHHIRAAIRTPHRGLPSNWQVKSPSQARALLTTALVAMLFLAACGSEPAVDGAATARQQGIPPGIEGLEQQANQLLDGGPKAFKARLAELEGHPVVVNQWASWCGPCRFEFPFFERQAKRLQGRVAFLGVSTRDSRDNAAAFLKEHPVPYPHYFDPDGSVARVFRGGRAFPTTAFYDASGKLSYTHVGGYASEAKLQEEIERYAVDG